MNIRKTILLVAALAFVLGGAGLYSYTRYQARDLDHVEAAPEEGGEHEEDEHAEDEHGEEGHVDAVKLTPEQLKEFEIDIAEAGPGSLDSGLNLTGEVKLNEDKLAHIVPKLAGVVREVNKSLGDEVKPGEVMTVIESRELASAKAKFLSAGERVALAQATFAREKNLWERKISAEKDYLEARQVLAEARIAQREAEQELHTLGFSDAQLAKLPGLSDEAMTRFEVVAPFSGTVIEKHVTLGEAIETDAGIFVVADLTSVWMDFNVHQSDLASVRKGQAVRLRAGAGQPETEAVIAYVGPVVGAETRTAIARAIVENPDGLWRPGQYVTGNVAFEKETVPVLVPKTAIQNVDGSPSVFVKDEDGLEATPVTLGRSSETHQEIVEGLEPGQRYAATGSFVLKAALQKGELGHQH
ncbi:MAG: efflux RND transporter periplasmic adaptor subunit [FCB group bacterium]|jgi:cobalt-zinc-cadmium efflux system membrane fusion protein|nr:efflux RND transporter periplasmic adaptor subunit [FCB group bacterium]